VPFWSRGAREDRSGELYLVVGLGNPGSRFERTRHNVGFMVANELAHRMSATFRSSRQRADIAKGTLEGLPLIVARPVTFMNLSGTAVSRLVQYYHVPLARLLIVCDDMDLPFGTLRIRPSGSSGGNNGLKSVIEELGTQEFARMRIGVGRPRGEAIDHVLSRFPPQQERMLPQLIRVAADAVPTALRDVRAAMNEYNRSWAETLTEA
jgi:PTH1 family peptidyl-tRNA hydrolase